MSLTRNPWHYREYNPEQMKQILETSFTDFEIKGVFGLSKVLDYYEKNKLAVNKILKWDIFNLQYLLPRFILQIPYDILNRINRQNLKSGNDSLVEKITINDFEIKDMNDKCFDYFCIATKSLKS